jgi:hypothetical protein
VASWRRIVVLGLTMGVCACSGSKGTVLSLYADRELLLAVDGISRPPGKNPTASVHYFFSHPRTDHGREYVHNGALFDCANRSSRVLSVFIHPIEGDGYREVNLTPVWQNPLPNTLGADAIRAVCDPDYARAVATSQSLEQLHARFLMEVARHS